MEEETHLEQAAVRVHVLVIDDSTYGRFVHSDVVGDILEHQRTQFVDSMIEETALKLNDGLRDLVDRSLSFLETLDQAQRLSQFLLDVFLGFFTRLLGATGEHASIDRTDVEPR